MAKSIQKAAIAATAFKVGKSRGKKVKNSSLKQGAHTGRKPVGNSMGSAQPPYTVLPVSTVALTPGQGPPMSSTPTGSGPSVSSISSRSTFRSSASRAKRGSRRKK